MPRKHFGHRINAARFALSSGPDELRALDADRFFTLDFVRDFFTRGFRLDSQNRDDRDRLLIIFLTAHLSRGEPGRPPTGRDFNQLIWDLEAAGRKKSDREVCRILIEDNRGKFGGRYKDARPEALRHRLRELRKLLGDN